MIQITQTSKQQYLDFLKDCHEQTIGDGLSMAPTMKKHGVSQLAAIVMKEGGIVSNNGKRGPWVKWTWGSKVPNDMMALELIRRINAYFQDKKEVEPKPKEREDRTKPMLQAQNERIETKTAEDFISDAIRILKQAGYKILKTEYVEV